MKKWKENFVIYSSMSFFFFKLSNSLRFDYKLVYYIFFYYLSITCELLVLFNNVFIKKYYLFLLLFMSSTQVAFLLYLTFIYYL